MLGADRLASTLAELVRIPSVNPGQSGPRSNDDGERAMTAWLAERTADLGAVVTLDEVRDGRTNVYAHFSGAGAGVVAVDVHLDTVGVEHMEGDPFDGRIESGRVYGRGSVDTKATLPVVLSVIEELTGSNALGPSVYVVGSIGEEVGGLPGARRFRRWLQDRGERIDQIVVAEPTSCAPVHGHPGGLGLEVTIRGHAAHSSSPHLGRNAVSGAARVIVAVDDERRRLADAGGTTTIGAGVCSVTEIEGGLARNIIPDRCSLYVGRRLVPGEDPDAHAEQLTALVRGAAAPCEADVSVVYGRGIPAFHQDPAARLPQLFAALSGEAPQTAGYGSNALIYDDSVADEVIVFGPGSIDQAHQAVEWIEIDELGRAADIYTRWLRASPG